MTPPLKRFILVYLAVQLAIIVIFLAVLSPWLKNQLIGQAETRLVNLAETFAEHLRQGNQKLDSPEALRSLRPMAERTGLELVLFDKDSSPLGSWPEGATLKDGPRPELRLAAREDHGFDRREREPGTGMVLNVAVAYPERDQQPLQGFIRLALPERDAIQIDGRLRQLLWLFGLSLAALAAAVMWSYARREMEPLQEFSEAARRIAAGQYDDVPSVLGRSDEWRNLSDAFRQMQTELESRERRLEENSERLEAVLSSMIEGVVALDSHGAVMLANQAACEMLGLSQAQLLGRQLLELVRIPQLRQAIDDTRSNRTFSSVEFQTLDLPRKIISARVSILTDEREPGVTLVLQDITELRHLENMRRDFVANVSHELKTPLSSIRAYAETLLMGAINDPDNNLQFVQQIDTQAQLLYEQIIDLLQLAKVEAGQAMLDITQIKVAEVCDEVVRLRQAEANSRNIGLEQKPPAEEVVAQADWEAMRTIIDNLVSNAIRYTPEGGLVTVSWGKEGNEVFVSVADTGIGIAPEHQPRIFERFYRVDKARSREMGGTGLGLSIVKHLVQVLGGSVRLNSKVGKGSTFQIRVPAAKK
jgi:two-component system phosphate regulon sensor histidine kinase PhoR